jgi:TetR/AcrR family transcriptional repressor of nem operon
MPRQKKARSRETRKATARGAATRARIVEAAAGLVHLRGAGATSLEDIMAASAVSKSQLYHYFADKDALMRAVIEFQTRRVTGGETVELEAFDSIDKLRRWRDGIVAMNKAARAMAAVRSGRWRANWPIAPKARGRCSRTALRYGNPIS